MPKRVLTATEKYWEERAVKCVLRSVKDIAEANEYLKRAGYKEEYIVDRKRIKIEEKK